MAPPCAGWCSGCCSSAAGVARRPWRRPTSTTRAKGRRRRSPGSRSRALPLDVDLEHPDLAEGWALAERALTMPAPRPPTGEDWEVETWADDELADWMRRRGEAITAAQRALDAARHGDPGESVVASTILGLAYARFALDVRGLDTPAAFARSDERARAYREALEEAAQPLWLRALDAFGSCASVAGAQPAHSLDRWRERCDREGREASAMLPGGADD